VGCIVPHGATSPAKPTHRDVTWRYLAELHARASAVVARHYRRRLTLDVVARSLATSPRQLQRAYAEVGHTTFATELRSVRLRNAAELLARQPLTVIDVARLVGYRQPSHFVKAFRRRYGVTPGGFRDDARGRSAPNASVRARRETRPAHVPASGSVSGLALQHRPAASCRLAHRQARAVRRYSNPNSRVLLGADGEDDGRDDDEADDAPPEDARPALAECAEDDACLGDVEPADPEPASKPNSLLACVADDADADPLAPLGADGVAGDGRRTVCVIGAGARAAPDERVARGFDDRSSATEARMWWRSRGSGPPRSPIWSQTT
jgi:AraC family transcriptional regulator, regulatory protein of adaptative response / methylphosphotriester-DNA alkyltransferase methyltransferase